MQVSEQWTQKLVVEAGEDVGEEKAKEKKR